MGLNKELDGMTVVSLEQAVAAPYCGLMLSKQQEGTKLGARTDSWARNVKPANKVN